MVESDRAREEENEPWKIPFPQQTRCLPRQQPRRQVCAKLDGLSKATPPGEVLLRMLLVKYLYDWSEQQTAEQVEDSLVLRWFCRLGLQQAPSESLVSQAAGQVSVAELEALANRVEQASERAKESEGRLRPTYRQRWR